jgi:hypothetical protein
VLFSLCPLRTFSVHISMPPRDLNNALQKRLAEYGLSFESLPEIPAMVEHFLAGRLSRPAIVTALEKILWFHVTSIPRKGARGGYDHIGSPDSRLHFLVEDMMTILDAHNAPRISSDEVPPPKRR